MTQRTSRLLVGAAGLTVATSIGVAVWFALQGSDPGTPSTSDVTIVVIIVIALLVNLAVGAVVALARRDNPVGWLFLGLGLVLLLEAPTDGYVGYGPGLIGTLPASRAIVVVMDSTWILWFTIVGLILLLTPDGRPLSPRWRLVARLYAAAGVTAFLLAVPSGRRLDAPYEQVQNPMRVDAIQPWADWVQIVCVYMIGIGLIASGVSLLLRFRRATGDERRQLLWLVFTVAPLPLYVVTAFVSSRNGTDVVTIIATAGFITIIPIAAGLSVLRFRLYDVERIVSATVAWALLSAILIATYASIIWLGARSVPDGPAPPVLSATIGALVAGGLAYPLRRWLQDQADRRFNRRAYDARRVIGKAWPARTPASTWSRCCKRHCTTLLCWRRIPDPTTPGSTPMELSWALLATTSTSPGTTGSSLVCASTPRSTTSPRCVRPQRSRPPSWTTRGSARSSAAGSRRPPGRGDRRVSAPVGERPAFRAPPHRA